MTTSVRGRGVVGLTIAVLMALAPAGAAAQTPAKELFGAQDTASAMPPESLGFYSKGCLAGGQQIAADGPTWQAMRLSRDRRYGHPEMIAHLERLGREAARNGWPGLLLGDISQARGGPLPFGHASHQVGLDADIWLQPMPAKRLTAQEREDFPFRSVLKEGTFAVDDRIWDARYAALIKFAAEDAKVQRVFVHPGIKKKLCETAGRDRGWLNKVRPIYGHDEHFHVRLFCQPGSPNCEPQQSTGKGDGCGDLDWWFDVALQPPPPDAKPYKSKPPLTLAALPNQCRVVLNAPAKGTGGAAGATAPAAASGAGDFAALPAGGVPVPTDRPLN